MLVDLKQLLDIIGEKRNICHEIHLSDLKSYKGIDFISPITIEGSFQNRAGVVSLSYNCNFRLNRSCDRCLKEFEEDFDLSFEHIIVRSLNTDNDEYIVAENDKIDLDDLVINDVMISLPSKVLCKDDCNGLCYTCGADLNESECNCNRL